MVAVWQKRRKERAKFQSLIGFKINWNGLEQFAGSYGCCFNP
ncbi:hypothetical protein BFG60_3036 [Microcystis aeruginosa NIES-98]|nr:hypothetical protein BFG60_3036 [Microcystis aeruginosa NIES-98]